MKYLLSSLIRLWKRIYKKRRSPVVTGVSMRKLTCSRPPTQSAALGWKSRALCVIGQHASKPYVPALPHNPLQSPILPYTLLVLSHPVTNLLNTSQAIKHHQPLIGSESVKAFRFYEDSITTDGYIWDFWFPERTLLSFFFWCLVFFLPNLYQGDPAICAAHVQQYYTELLCVCNVFLIVECSFKKWSLRILMTSSKDQFCWKLSALAKLSDTTSQWKQRDLEVIIWFFVVVCIMPFGNWVWLYVLRLILILKCVSIHQFLCTFSICT